jgi:hypothetical protein
VIAKHGADAGSGDLTPACAGLRAILDGQAAPRTSLYQISGRIAMAIRSDEVMQASSRRK